MLAARTSNGHLAARADVADVACASAFCGAHAVPRAIGRARVADDLGAITTREARIAVALLPIAPAMSGTVVWARGLHLRARAPSESAVAHALRVAPRRSDAAAVAGAPVRAVGAAERNGRREGQCYPNGHKSCENGKSAAVWNPGTEVCSRPRHSLARLSIARAPAARVAFGSRSDGTMAYSPCIDGWRFRSSRRAHRSCDRFIDGCYLPPIIACLLLLSSSAGGFRASGSRTFGGAAGPRPSRPSRAPPTTHTITSTCATANRVEILHRDGTLPRECHK